MIVNMQLVFENSQSTPLNELKSAIEEGSFGNLPIDKKSISIIFGGNVIDCFSIFDNFPTNIFSILTVWFLRGCLHELG